MLKYGYIPVQKVVPENESGWHPHSGTDINAGRVAWFGRDSGNGFVGMIAVNKSFAILLIPGNETVDVAIEQPILKAAAFLFPLESTSFFNDVVFSFSVMVRRTFLIIILFLVEVLVYRINLNSDIIICDIYRHYHI